MFSELAGGALSTAANVWSAENASKDAKMMAREQMQFQEKMSNTAYQRSADDMQKAGLNRILALGSGASTPSGASSGGYQSQSADFGGLSSSAKQNSTARAQQEQQKEAINSQMAVNETQKDVNKAIETKTMSDAMASQQSAKRTAAETKLLETQQGEAEARAKFIKDNPWMIQAKEYSNLVGQSLGNATSGLNIWNLLKKPPALNSEYGIQNGTPYNKSTGEIPSPRKGR